MPLGERHGEDAPFVDALLDLAEARRGDELVHLGLGAPAHDPGLALPMAGQRAGDQLELRVPGLAGIDEIAARRDRRRQPGERAAHHGVVGKQLVEAGDDAERRPRLDRRQCIAVEGVALDEAGDAGRAPSRRSAAVPASTLRSL